MKHIAYLKLQPPQHDKFPVSIYHCLVNAEQHVSAHYHEQFEILYVNSGIVRILMGTQEFEATEKSIFFASTFHIHAASMIPFIIGDH